MTVEQITRHAKKYSKTYGSDNGIWQKEFDAMALKTVLRNLLSHYGYLSIEMSAALNQDMEGDSVEEKVQGEIRGNANTEEIAFTEVNEQQPEDNCPI